jgi:hypothetical protein
MKEESLEFKEFEVKHGMMKNILNRPCIQLKRVFI